MFGSGWEGQGEPITDQRGEPEAKRGRSLLVKGVGLNQKGDASCLMLFLSVTLCFTVIMNLSSTSSI